MNKPSKLTRRGDHLEKKNRYCLFWARVLNPAALAVYGIACFYLYSLSKYGGVARKAPIILGCILVLFVWVIWCFYNRRKQTRSEQEKPHIISRTGIVKGWCIIACLILIMTTFITGVKIYQSGTNFNGKL